MLGFIINGAPHCGKLPYTRNLRTGLRRFPVSCRLSRIPSRAVKGLTSEFSTIRTVSSAPNSDLGCKVFEYIRFEGIH